MTMLTGALIGAMIAAGLMLIVTGWRGQRLIRPAGRRGTRRPRFTTADRNLLAAAIVVGLLIGLLTRWPVLAIGAAVAVWAVPKVITQRGGQEELDRLEALAGWMESLRDTISGSAGLEQAIPASVNAAAPAIREPLELLRGRMASRVPLPEALVMFADDLDDPSADNAIAALLMNSKLKGRGLIDTLTRLSALAREDLAQRQVIENGRRRMQRTSWWMLAAVGIIASLVLLLSRGEFAAPYATVQGQAFLLLVVAVFAGGFYRLRRLAVYEKPARIISQASLEAVR
ncbi:type II secretion system F family protein [Aeromicrobium sp. CTD01-1L150]|uniref:type II secretion system F family protein n=1 Tax=Aeromicrobium sp. CTD01-1L150 TaxID=3341830 RepID=UPI0035BEE449